jgi:hypothetical protein
MDKLKKLEEITKLLDKDTPSTQEVAEMFQGVFSVIETLKKELDNKLSDLDRNLSDSELKAEQKLAENIEALQASLTSLNKELNQSTESVRKELLGAISSQIEGVKSLIPDTADLQPIENMIRDLESKIPKIEPHFETSEDIRNKLELLQDDERLDASAIKNLDFQTRAEAEQGLIEAMNRIRLTRGVKSIIPGSNITATSDGDGNVTVSSSGGGTADNITGLIEAGDNVSLDGTGTLADPYVINSTGGSGDTIYTADGTLTGNRTVTLDGNDLSFLDDNASLEISSTNKNIRLFSHDDTGGGNETEIIVQADTTTPFFLSRASFNNGVNTASIEGLADATKSVINYYADEHNFPDLAAPSEETYALVIDDTGLVSSQAILGEANTGANVGDGTGEVFKEKSGVELRFRSIKAGTNITIDNNTNDVTINASGGGGTPGGSNDELQFNDAGDFGGVGLFLDTSVTDQVYLQTIAGEDESAKGITIKAGDGDGSAGAPLVFMAGASTDTGGANGGSIDFFAGSSTGSTAGGGVVLEAGRGGETGEGGSFELKAGLGGSTSGDGGYVDIIAGNADGGDSNGGDVLIKSGNGVGTGIGGNIILETTGDIVAESIAAPESETYMVTVGDDGIISSQAIPTGGGGQVDSVVGGTGIDVDDTDPENPEVSLDSATIASLALADSALQSLSGAVLTDQTVGQTIGDTTNRLTKLWATDITATNAIEGSVTGNAGTVTNGVYTTGADTVYLTPTTAASTYQPLDSDLTTWAGITPGTGVGTALAVNVGTAGAFVTNGGALGTPSSGVATNLTGTASGLTAGNVTTNANLTGVVTSTGNATAIADAALSIAKTSGLQTALDAKAPLANPTFTGTVSGITATMVGLGNVDNTSDATKNSATATLTNKTLTSPKVTAYDGVYIGANKALEIGQYDASAVNYVSVENAPTGEFPTVAAGGSDTNIDLNLTGQGTGGVRVNNVPIVTTTVTQTLTNKRVQPRTASSTSNANLTPDLSSANVYFRTTQTVTLAINAPTGTPVIGETIILYISAAGAQTINWNATYIPYGSALPTTTTAGKTLMATCQFNGTNWQTLTAVAI